MREITQNYIDMRDRSLFSWSKNSATGKELGHPYSKDLLGCVAGSEFNANEKILKLISDINKDYLDNPEIDISKSLHFTFLALSPLTYKTIDRLPKELEVLKNISLKHLKGQSFTVNNLRIVPLKNALLLAGIPDTKSIELRMNYTQDLLDSSWSEYIKERYKNGYDIPPKAWHTTLLRSSRELLPEKIRNIYKKYQNEDFGDLHFKSIKLLAANYNWTTKLELL